MTSLPAWQGWIPVPQNYVSVSWDTRTLVDFLSFLSLDVDKYEVSVYAKRRLRTHDICFIQIGGNDIGLLSNEKILTNILSFSEYLIHGLEFKIVIIGQLLRRDPHVSLAGYNEAILDINSHLAEKIKSDERVYFWRHRVFWQNLSYLARDGVHLNNPHLKCRDPASPMLKYWRSIRNAVIVHSRQLRPV